MRFALVALVVTLALALGGLALIVASAHNPRETRSSSGPDLRPPSSGEQRAAAKAAIAYLRALQLGRAEVACQHSAGHLAVQLRCATAPTIPKRLRLRRGIDHQPIDVDTYGQQISLAVSGQPGAVQLLSLRRRGGNWVVIDHRQGAYA